MFPGSGLLQKEAEALWKYQSNMRRGVGIVCWLGTLLAQYNKIPCLIGLGNNHITTNILLEGLLREGNFRKYQKWYLEPNETRKEPRELLREQCVGRVARLGR